MDETKRENTKKKPQRNKQMYTERIKMEEVSVMEEKLSP
jgi:hypothetical protein